MVPVRNPSIQCEGLRNITQVSKHSRETLAERKVDASTQQKVFWGQDKCRCGSNLSWLSPAPELVNRNLHRTKRRDDVMVQFHGQKSIRRHKEPDDDVFLCTTLVTDRTRQRRSPVAGDY